MGMKWNTGSLKDLVAKMHLQPSNIFSSAEQSSTPVHLLRYGLSNGSPLLDLVMSVDTETWAALGYDEIDRISLVRYLGGLGCLREVSLDRAVKYQQPLSLELARTLIDMGCRNSEALLEAAQHQRPLTPDLAELLIGAGCDPKKTDSLGRNALVHLAMGDHPVDPQVTDLFLSFGCSNCLDECGFLYDDVKVRFDQILQQHAMWKESRKLMAAENDPSVSDLNWGL